MVRRVFAEHYSLTRDFLFTFQYLLLTHVINFLFWWFMLAIYNVIMNFEFYGIFTICQGVIHNWRQLKNEIPPLYYISRPEKNCTIWTFLIDLLFKQDFSGVSQTSIENEWILSPLKMTQLEIMNITWVKNVICKKCYINF